MSEMLEDATRRVVKRGRAGVMGTGSKHPDVFDITINFGQSITYI